MSGEWLGGNQNFESPQYIGGCNRLTQYVVVDIWAGIAYNIGMIQTPPRLSTMRTMAGSPFLGEKHEGVKTP